MNSEANWLIIHANAGIGLLLLESLKQANIACFGSSLPYLKKLEEDFFQVNSLENSNEAAIFQQWIESRMEDCKTMVINLSGIGSEQSQQRIEKISFDDWAKEINQFLKIPFFLIQERIQDWLIQRKGGKLIFLLPLFCQVKNHPGFAAIHTALVSFSRSIAKEYGLKRIYSNVLEIDLEKFNYQKFTEAVLFLGSNDSDLIDGEVFRVKNSHE